MTEEAEPTKEIATIGEGAFAVLASPTAKQALQETLVDMGGSMFDLNKVSVPSGGGQIWEIQTAAGTEGEKELDIIIAGIRPRTRTWYRVSLDEGGGDSPPDCSSIDGITGYGSNTLELEESVEPGDHECRTCQWAQWGSARKGGKGQDCTTHALLMAFRPKSRMPFLLSVPPTSLKPMRKYGIMLTDSESSLTSVVTRLTLRKVAGGNPYSVIEWSMVRPLTEPEREEMGRVRAIMHEAMASDS